ncbi:MAG: intradiol ring-cleavage dioxygenase, partial [Flavobacteriales bacterium]
KFLKNGLLGLGSLVAAPTLLSSCKDKDSDGGGGTNPEDCKVTPTEIAGPFPIKTPADWVRENIIGSKAGVPLMINLKIEDINDDCKALADVSVDIWQCDAKGNYSEYAGQLDGDFTNEHFLRGRQTTNADGEVSFISIFPGWYPGRAPHLHLEIKSSSGDSLLVTQTAFPEAISTEVYTNSAYNGNFDTSNTADGGFYNSLDDNMLDEITGNLTDGFTMRKTIRVKA